MYRVAVCDDEKLLQEEICRMCGEILQDMGVQHKIQAFGSTKELLAALDVQEGFDLICLDIMMPEKNGMEFAYEFRRRDEETSILFISSSTTYLLDGYGVRPVQYLLKPVQRAALEKALADDIRLNHTPTTVSITEGAKTTVLPLAEIRYVESRSHGCDFVLEGRTQFFWIPMSQAETMLPRDGFSRCHNSYLVNLAQVVRTHPQEVELQGGQRIPISHRYAKGFQSALIRFLNTRA